MALGARHLDVLGIVMKEGAAMVFAGCAIGFAAARAGTRLLAAFMSDVARISDTNQSAPMLLAGAPLLLVVLAFVCCYVPARRSMLIDPAVTLRAE
jgi:ABC-type lipoprotein release transport system permease subunit